MLNFSSFKQLRQGIDLQLKPGVAYDVPTFAQRAIEMRKEISKAWAEDNAPQAMSAAAAYGGLVKRWHHWLIVHVTAVALADQETSAWRVKQWQKALFGKSIAERDLAQYADPARGSGDRVPELLLNDAKAQEAAELFKEFKDALRRR